MHAADVNNGRKLDNEEVEYINHTLVDAFKLHPGESLTDEQLPRLQAVGERAARLQGQRHFFDAIQLLNQAGLRLDVQFFHLNGRSQVRIALWPDTSQEAQEPAFQVQGEYLDYALQKLMVYGCTRATDERIISAFKSLSNGPYRPIFFREVRKDGWYKINV